MPEFSRRVATALLCGLAFALTACGDEAAEYHEPVSARTNAGNDGSAFEPCDALTTDRIDSLGGDPTTWTDISMPGKGPRGCRATSQTQTMTLMVIDAGTSTLYPSRLATWAGNDQGSPIDRYRFANANACAAVIYSGESVVALSFSDDRPQPVDAAIGDVLCQKAAQALGRVDGELDAPTSDATFDVTADDAKAVGYFQLMQAGKIADPGAAAIGADGRLVSYTDLEKLDDSTRGKAEQSLVAINDRLQGF